MVEKCDMGGALIKLYDDGKSGFVFRKNKAKSIKKQYTVFVTSLMGTLNTLAGKSVRIRDYLSKGTCEHDSGIVEGWKTMSDGELREIHRRENTKIGEDLPKSRATSGADLNPNHDHLNGAASVPSFRQDRMKDNLRLILNGVKLTPTSSEEKYMFSASA